MEYKNETIPPFSLTLIYKVERRYNIEVVHK